nr:reverse transcriptase domain-containing protein [Tanacetum cinerariifolium]
MFLEKYFPPSMVKKLENEITNFRQRPDASLFEEWESYKLSIDRCPNHNMLTVPTKVIPSNHKATVIFSAIVQTITLDHQGNNQGRNQFFQGSNQGQKQPQAYQALAYQAPVYQALVHQSQIPQHQVVTTNEFTNFMKANDAILNNMQTNMTSLTDSNLELKNMFGPTIPTTPSSRVVERETEATKDIVHPTNNGSTKNVQPTVDQYESSILTSELVISPIIEPIASPVSAPRHNQRPLIPYPSRLQDQKLRDKANDQRENFFQIFENLNFNISFSDALILMPKFGPSIKNLLTNKDKLCELAKTPLNKHCSMVLLKKLPEKLRDPSKFLILCDFPGMAECLALADLDASINLMPFSVWNKLSLPNLSPKCMTLELADHLISHPVGVAKDLFVKVGTFHFPADFVVVDFDVDPRVPLILDRSFLKTERALIDMFEGKLTLRVGKEAITFNLEYSQEVLGFSDVIASGNPTPYYDPIVSTTSPTLTLFKNSDFLLEEVDAFLALEDDPTLPEVDQSYLESEGDILLLEAFLNDDPSLPPPNQGNHLPEVHKELKICEAKSDKSSIDEPPEVELKDLPPHLEYIFLEERMLKRCEDTNLCLNWEKSHFMVKEGIILGHKISIERIEVGKAKVDVITKLPHPTTVKAPILIAPDWDMPFELMCDASDFAISTVQGQRQEKHFRPIHYASKTMTEAESNYTTTEKEMLAVVKLNELRDQAYENSLIYKEKTKRLHDLKIKDRVFNISDRVLHFNSRLKIFSSKLKSRLSGPFTISHVFPYGTVELSQPDGPNFKVNGHKLKHYFGEDVSKMVVPDLQTFPKDH